ncbi:MAG: hypothetical protein JWP75_1972 [Frondihabitans sp.]|nr:hypothetical protein [Frondihabitans sp.]
MDLTGQYEHRFQFDFDHDHPVPERLPAAAELASWRAGVFTHEERAQRDRPADPAASFSGEWWSAPICGLTTSTRLLGDRGPWASGSSTCLVILRVGRPGGSTDVTTPGTSSRPGGPSDPGAVGGRRLGATRRTT